MVRPMSGVNALAEAMGREVPGRGRRRRRDDHRPDSEDQTTPGPSIVVRAAQLEDVDADRRHRRALLEGGLPRHGADGVASCADAAGLAQRLIRERIAERVPSIVAADFARRRARPGSVYGASRDADASPSVGEIVGALRPPRRAGAGASAGRWSATRWMRLARCRVRRGDAMDLAGSTPRSRSFYERHRLRGRRRHPGREASGGTIEVRFRMAPRRRLHYRLPRPLRSNRLGEGGAYRMEISKVGVVGCGLMGHGIAQICAQAGWDVVVREVDQDRLDAGIGKIEKQLARAVEKGKLEQADADAIRARIAADARLRRPRRLRPGDRGDHRGPRREARDVAGGRRDRQATTRSSRPTPPRSRSPTRPPRPRGRSGSSACTSSTRRR